MRDYKNAYIKIICIQHDTVDVIEILTKEQFKHNSVLTLQRRSADCFI